MIRESAMTVSTRNCLIALALTAIASVPAAAMAGGWRSDGPNCGVLADAPFRDVWLGHFTGGRWVRGPYGDKVMDWRDDHVCFASRARCDIWQGRMRAAFHQIGGYRTCIRIR